MSDSQIKPIKINPELFNLNPRRARNKTLKKKPSVINIKPNKLKTELIAKIKNFKQNKGKEQGNSLGKSDGKPDGKPDGNDDIQTKKSINSIPNLIMIKNINKEPDDEFTASLNFLKELSSKKNKKLQNKSSLDKNLSINEPENFNDSNKSLTSTISTPHSETLSTPQYGCLRNGTLPTYREWKNKTLKKSNIELEQSSETETINESINECNIKSNIKPNTKTTTLKYYLGKRGRKVSVLVKNAETRKNISNEHLLLKQAKISDIKGYLKRHNLLKSGSHAPPDVIKKMYEQVLLSGEIRNSNKDNLIHNYLAES